MIWKRYRKGKHDRDGLWLVRLRGGAIHLGMFCCGSFLMDGHPYPDKISRITHLQRVKFP